MTVPLPEPIQPSTSNVVYVHEDEAIVRGLLDRNPAALDALYKKYISYVRTILVQTLGHTEQELDDRTQEVFLTAWNSAHRIRERQSLKYWLGSVAVHKALDAIRARKRRRWLLFSAPDTLPERPTPVAQTEATRALRLAYRLLDTMPTKERVPFCLRRIEGMPLAEVAALCNTSLATINRRISAAHRRFMTLASATPALCGWLDQNGDWRTP